MFRYNTKLFNNLDLICYICNYHAHILTSLLETKCISENFQTKLVHHDDDTDGT